VTSPEADSTDSNVPNSSLPSPSRADAARDRVVDALRVPLLQLGLDLEALEITPAGKRRVLRVAVDKDGGPTLDDVAEATRAVSGVLDDSDLMGQLPYTLEVTSRGVDRPLLLPRHWRRNADRLVRVTLSDGDQLQGRVLASDEAGVDVSVDGGARRIPYDAIVSALVQIEFSRPGPRAPEPDPESDI
jgi:ribosome maturation factor RimP